MEFAEIIIPRPLYSTFTYRIPEELQGKVKIGFRVLVSFGPKRFYTGIVNYLHNNKPEGYEVKNIVAVLDEQPVIRHPQLKFWEWISSYYLCSLGEVYKAAVPAGLKLESETFVSANPDYIDTEEQKLTEREALVYTYLLTKSKQTPNEIAKATELKNILPTINSLIDKEAVYITETVVDNYRPVTEVYVELCAKKGNQEEIKALFEKVKRAKKQETALLAFLELSRWMNREAAHEVKKDELMARSEVGTGIIKKMADNGIFRLVKKEINRFKPEHVQTSDAKPLSDLQRKAYDSIIESFREKQITLLHGVTSSGKTEIYIHLIEQVLKQRKQVLYLVPEIALTTQLTQRLQKVFGSKLLIYHSKFSDNERVDIWKRLLNGNEPCVVLGVRSSIFLPFAQLGLIIVDEEHETSYKQQDPAPRYNARDAALVLASMHGAKTLLGSATPAITTYYNAVNGKYGFVELLVRHEGIQMPDVKIIDTTRARKRREMNGLFSNELLAECQKATDNGEQVILFQNRRGFSPMVRCKECAWIPKCENCDVSLTYHKHLNHLSCHYCGFTIPLPNICPVCRQPAIEIIGYGTERIEDDIEGKFPNCKVARMDLDTTRKKDSYEKIIDSFSNRKTQILVGTQMVSKGLDFDGVSVVGILNADTVINFPDFRSHERAFNMMEQVAGRAGRKHKQGTVYIQTSEPEHPIIKYVVAHDYKGYYKNELEERKRYNYPPFCRIINIYIKHRDDSSLTEISVRFSNMLRQVFGKRVLGPEAPLVARIQQLFIRQIVLKVETTASMSKVKEILRAIYEQSLDDPRMKSAVVYYDVDPM